MKKFLLSQVLKTALPAVAGAVGLWMLTEYPAVHKALCVVG